MTDIGQWPAGRELYRDLKERLAALMDEQVVTERCASCPDFVIEAPFKEAKAQFRAHVETAHPERVAALNRKRMPMRIMPKEQRRDPELAVLERLDAFMRAAA